MRESKFRGKRIDNDKWVYGDLQWFIAEEAKAWVNQGLYAPIGSFEKCLLEHRVGIPARKATVEEIIEHFKKREK